MREKELLLLKFCRSVKDFLEGIEDGNAIGKNAIRKQEGVEEVDRQEAQISESFEQSFRCGVANLRNLSNDF